MSCRPSRPYQAAFILAAVLCVTSSSSAADTPGKVGKIRWQKIKLIENLNEGIDIADVNRDGKLDVIAGPNWFEGPRWQPHPLRNVEPRGGEFLNNNGDHAIDLNGDGWVDVIAASWFDSKIYWYENPGKEGLAKQQLWQQHLITDGQEQCEGTILTDFDGDKVPELVVNSWTKEKPQIVIRIRPGREGAAPQFDVVQLGGPGTGHGTAVGDINGDGRPDLLVCQGWFEQPADDWTKTKWTFHKAFDLAHISLPCVITDLTGDGKNDVIVGQGHEYDLRWLEQGPGQNGETAWTVHPIDKSISQLHCLAWVDLDGDGHNELVTGKRWRGHQGRDPGANEPVCLVRYLWDPGTKTFEKDIISFDDGVGGGMQIRTADLNGDKKLDIAVAGKTGTYILLNRGSAKRER